MSLEGAVLILGRFNGPFGICVDDSKAVYVADVWNCHVQVF